LHFSVPTQQKPAQKLDRVAGIDLGVRTFATVHTSSLSGKSPNVVTEYKHNAELLIKYNRKINALKARKSRTRKKHLCKLDMKKKNLIDGLHWEFINDLLSQNDVIYIGDIKSHDMVKNSKKKYLNVAFNDLKFHQLKQRLLYKAGLCGKKVFLVKEHYTTKTCSCCGVINNNVGSKEVFECSQCGLLTGRDMNASKNMKMKGMLHL
jgi:IS605 OrfB family transposase